MFHECDLSALSPITAISLENLIQLKSLRKRVCRKSVCQEYDFSAPPLSWASLQGYHRFISVTETDLHSHLLGMYLATEIPYLERDYIGSL